MLTVVLAIVLALGGTGLVLVYVKQANARAVAGQKAVSVLVAQRLIPAGMPASTAERDGLLQSQTLPARSVPPNAVRAITPDLAALVANADIQAGQLLLRPMLVTAALASASGGVAVPTGMDAVTIDLCLPEAVAGYIHPGSVVAVFDTAVGAGGSVSAAGNCSGAHAQQTAKAKTQLVLARAAVLSVGAASPQPSTGTGSATSTAFTQSSASSSGSSQGGTLVTLAVTPNDAKRLILLTVTGLPYLALLN
jgi:pilus assembly protein CpaB